MIFDKIQNIDNYKGLGRVYDALLYLSEHNFNDAKAGTYKIDGDNIFYNVVDYTTDGSKNIAEIHKDYIDIQFLIKGEELMGIGSMESPKTLVEERPQNDIWLYECDLPKFPLNVNEFMVLFPSDLHAPGVAKNEPCKCRKIVVKVRV